MTPEERQMLGGLFQRVNSAAATQRDPEAESFISNAVRAAPHAPYVLAQTVLVQQQALEAAANRISELEATVQQGADQSQEQGSFLGNLGKTIFGGGPSSPPPRPDSDPQSYQRAPTATPSRGYAPPPPQAAIPRRTPRHKAIRNRGGPWGQPQPSRRRISAERGLDGDGSGRRRCPWQSVGRPVRRTFRRRPFWRRGKRRRIWRLGPDRQPDRDDRDQQLLRRRGDRGATPISRTSIPARRGSRTPTSTSWMTRVSTIRTARHLTTAAAASTTSEVLREGSARRLNRADPRPSGPNPFRWLCAYKSDSVARS